MVVAATLGGWIAGAALARDAALLASGLVLIDLPLRVDAAAAAHVDERLHEAGLLAPGQAQWDVRLRDAFEPSEMAARFADVAARSEEHKSELQSLMRISYAVFCLQKKKNNNIESCYTD